MQPQMACKPLRSILASQFLGLFLSDSDKTPRKNSSDWVKGDFLQTENESMKAFSPKISVNEILSASS